MKRIRIRVTGKVQKIGFRYSARQKALELGVSGSAVNNPDGSVGLEAEGEAAELAAFADWCRVGPPWAKVDSFEMEEMPLKHSRGFVTG